MDEQKAKLLAHKHDALPNDTTQHIATLLAQYLQARPNDRNTPVQHIVTLLSPTYCMHLVTLLPHVAC